MNKGPQKCHLGNCNECRSPRNAAKLVEAAKWGLLIMISVRLHSLSQHGIIFSAAREIGKCEIALSLSLARCPTGALFISGGRKGGKEEEM